MLEKGPAARAVRCSSRLSEGQRAEMLAYVAEMPNTVSIPVMRPEDHHDMVVAFLVERRTIQTGRLLSAGAPAQAIPTVAPVAAGPSAAPVKAAKVKVEKPAAAVAAPVAKVTKAPAAAPPPAVRKAKKQKLVDADAPMLVDPNAPKPETSAYEYFTADKTFEVRNKLKSCTVQSVGDAIGELWDALSEEDRQPYLTSAVKDQARFFAETAAYARVKKKE